MPGPGKRRGRAGTSPPQKMEDVMTERLLALLMACVSGSAMAVQGTLNSALGKVTGLFEASWVVHLSGLFIVSALLFILRLGAGSLREARSAEWYTLLGGPLNVLIIYLVVSSIPRVGVAPATTAIIVGQVVTAAAIDHFGLFGMKAISFNVTKGIGIVLLAIGAKLLLS